MGRNGLCNGSSLSLTNNATSIAVCASQEVSEETGLEAADKYTGESLTILETLGLLGRHFYCLCECERERRSEVILEVSLNRLGSIGVSQKMQRANGKEGKNV